MATVIVINKSQMGSGDEEIGRKILTTCLRKLASFPDLEAVILYNDGVRLAVQGSFVASEVSQLYENGVDILTCGTCLDHLGLSDQILFDRASNMDEILATLRAADKVITL